MNEKLLQYIWQYQLYNPYGLKTAEGQKLEIIFRGNSNTNQGPDFLDAKIKVEGTFWAGNIELHILASDWIRHRHREDANYRNVILHVVWENDQPIGENFPTLELQHLVPKILLQKYQTLSGSNVKIPCGNNMHTVKDIVLAKWKERLLAERLKQKSIQLKKTVYSHSFHWKEIFCRMLARNFGTKVNAGAFEQISESIPFKIIQRHESSLFQIESILFGQAGFLRQTYGDEYPQQMRKEYLHLQRKYGLAQPQVALYFLRMRPANFPTIRLAQLAVVFQKIQLIFSAVLEKKELETIRQLFCIAPSEYWNSHYLPDKESVFKLKSVGTQMTDNIIINTIVPLLFTYGWVNDRQDLQEKAISWLEAMPGEKNTITQLFEKCGLSNNNASDSQAFIQLYNEYCLQKNCLKCSIGNSILGREFNQGVAEVNSSYRLSPPADQDAGF